MAVIALIEHVRSEFMRRSAASAIAFCSGVSIVDIA